MIAGTLFVYYNRGSIAPGSGQWVQAGTVVVLVVVGTAAIHWPRASRWRSSTPTASSSADGSRLAEEVLEALRCEEPAEARPLRRLDWRRIGV